MNNAFSVRGPELTLGIMQNLQSLGWIIRVDSNAMLFTTNLLSIFKTYFMG